MFVVMGYTRGDELIRSEARPLFVDPDRTVCEARMAEFEMQRDGWLKTHEPPEWAKAAIYSQFEIVETPFR